MVARNGILLVVTETVLLCLAWVLFYNKSWILESGPSSQNCRNALNCRIVGRKRSIDGLEGDGREGVGRRQNCRNRRGRRGERGRRTRQFVGWRSIALALLG